MRRIYESDALERDDDDPLSPRDRQRETEPQSFRSISGSAWSDRLLPHGIRKRAVAVSLSVPDRAFEQGDSVPFRITLKNRLPIPVAIATNSSRLWTWSIDGHTNASHLPPEEPPATKSKLRLDRGERHRIQRTWSGMFRVSKREWVPAESGEHTLRVAVNVDDADDAGLADEATIQVD